MATKDPLHACRTACTTFQRARNSLPGTPSAWCLEIMGVLCSPRQLVRAVLLGHHSALVAAHHPSLHCLAGLC